MWICYFSPLKGYAMSVNNFRRTTSMGLCRPRFIVETIGMALLLVASASAKELRAIDIADLASASSRRQHQVEFMNAEICAERFDIGALTLPVSGVRLMPGGSVRTMMKTEEGRLRPVSLVITLGTAPRDYGKRQQYTVRFDGKLVYAASEIDSGGGFTRSIVLDPPATPRLLEVEVSSDPDSRAPVVVCSIRCYATSGSGNGVEPASRLRMGLALLTSKGYGYSLDVPTMHEIFALQPRTPFLSPELAIVYNFCSRDRESNEKEIDTLVSMAEKTGIPLRIAYQFHWGGIPRGVPDTGGVTFSDLPYQMITYDPDDHVDDPGLAALLGDRYDVRFGLSVPNVWSNTPWLTFNHPRLNQFRHARLDDVLRAWHTARSRLAESGKDSLLPPQLSTGEETVYWAKGVNDSLYTILNGGTPREHLMADFNPFVVEDARRDGVTLDPRDGLDLTERWWLHQNMARWQQKIVKWMMADSPPEPIRLRGTQPVFASDLIRRNIFTEPYAMPLFPMKDIDGYHPGMEVGYVRDGRSGGEYWSGATILPLLQKERERGRIALPNVECTVTDDGQLVSCMRAAYSFGARFTTLYNWHTRTNIKELLRAFADSIATPPGLVWIPRVSVSSGKGGSKKISANLHSRHVRTYIAPPVAFGINRVELFFVPGTPPPSLLRVTLRPVHSTSSASDYATVVERPSPQGSKSSIVVEFPTVFRQEPNHRYELVVEPGKADACEFARADDGLIAARLLSDLIRERSRSFLVEDWQDAYDLLASLRVLLKPSSQSDYAKDIFREAARQFEAGRPQEAYRLAIRAEQLAFPTTYDISAPGGRLKPYPIDIRCPVGSVRAVIGSFDRWSTTVTITSRRAQTVRVQFAGEGKLATVSPDSPSTFRFRKRK